MATENSNFTFAASQNNGGEDVANTNAPAMGDAFGNEDETSNNEVRTAATSSENFTDPTSTVEPAPSSLKCRFLPHGVYAVIPSLLSMLAWFACLSKDGCDYARVAGPIVADITNNPSTPFIHAGFNHYREPNLNTVTGEWKMDFNLPCREYNTDIVAVDGVWVFAKITSFLSLVFGGSGALFIWFSSCFVFRKNTWHWAGYELLIATSLLTLTYSWFATSLCHGNDGKDNCTMQYGARADILACVLWATSVLLIFCKYPAEKKTAQESNSIQNPPPELEMSNQSVEQRVGVAADEHEII